MKWRTAGSPGSAWPFRGMWPCVSWVAQPPSSGCSGSRRPAHWRSPVTSTVPGRCRSCAPSSRTRSTGSTVHWGQRNDLNMKQVEAMYDAKAPTGSLYRWREALALITDNGRLSLFTTAFTRDRGLDVVQPRVKDFSVSPSNTCANGPVVIEWRAASNPPGTTASLEIRPSGSSGPPVAVIPLATLDGAQQVAVPAGNSDFTLVVATTLNGRTLTDRSAPFLVRGFPDHDLFRLVRSATCLSVDGQLRWGVEVSFASTVSASLAVEEVTCNFVGASAWTMRRSGVPDEVFLERHGGARLAHSSRSQGHLAVLREGRRLWRRRAALRRRFPSGLQTLKRSPHVCI